MSVSETTRRLAAERLLLEAELRALRPKLFDAIRHDARAGSRQVDLVDATGYTREMIRRIVGANGT
jgi:hypothetical protein